MAPPPPRFNPSAPHPTRRRRVTRLLQGRLLNLACNTLVGPGNIPGIAPALVVPVIEDNMQFAQTGDETLADVAPGTVTDDLNTLNGCWGAYYVTSSYGFAFTGYEAYSFNSTTGEGTYAVLQGAFVAIEQSFTFTVTGNDRIRIRRQLPDNSFEEVDALVTLSGTEMKIAYLSQDGNALDGASGEADDERVALVFRQFTCP